MKLTKDTTDIEKTKFRHQFQHKEAESNSDMIFSDTENHHHFRKAIKEFIIVNQVLIKVPRLTAACSFGNAVRLLY